MVDKETFWKGVSAGFLAGMAVAAALRYSPFERFINNLSTLDGKLDRNLQKLEANHDAVSVRRPLGGEIVSGQVMRVEQLETAGDLSAAASRTATAGRSTAEVAGAPANDRVDHIDLSQPLRRYPRSMDLGSAG